MEELGICWAAEGWSLGLLGLTHLSLEFTGVGLVLWVGVKGTRASVVLLGALLLMQPLSLEILPALDMAVLYFPVERMQTVGRQAAIHTHLAPCVASCSGHERPGSGVDSVTRKSREQ